VLRLQDQGELSVDDPLPRFFEGVPQDKRTITVHHLLTHTSGLPLRYAADGLRDRSEAVRTILALPLECPVGEAWHYSGDGFVLLAAVIEVASGKTFEEYLRMEVLAPAGMKDMGFWGLPGGAYPAPPADPEKVKQLAPTVFQDGQTVANWGWRGSTGMHGTGRDLHALMQAVRHTGSESELGHNGILSLQANGDAIVVLSNAGDAGDQAWSIRVFLGLRTLLAP
jgi:CubicO group peptidase (beta-lactamase class C family)